MEAVLNLVDPLSFVHPAPVLEAERLSHFGQPLNSELAQLLALEPLARLALQAALQALLGVTQ